jgi:quercetin dioxygenase-like cupin family protein
VSNLVDFAALPVIDLWGETVRGRRVEGQRVTLALVELARNAVVPGHRHEHEQLGMCITGQLRFTVGDEVRDVGPGGTWRIPSGVYHQVAVGPDGASVIEVFAPVRADWDGLPHHAPARPAWPAEG